MPRRVEDASAIPLRNRIRFALDRAILGFCILILVCLAVIIISAVFFRKFGYSLVWYDEVASVLLAWLTFYSCSLAALRGAHLDFGGFLHKLQPAVRLAAFLLGKVVVIAFFGVLAYAGWFVLDLMEGEYLISLEWVPMSLTQSALPIGAVLFIIAELVSLPDQISELGVCDKNTADATEGMR